MTIAKPKRRSPGTPAPAHDPRKHLAIVVRRASGAIAIARTGATRLIVRVPAALRVTRAGVDGTTAALQTLPDSTLRWIAATSVGFGAGLRLAGAPRLVSAAGAAPALIVGVVIALRPTEPVVPTREHAAEPVPGTTDMTDEHAKRAISSAQGTVEEGLGTLTGNRQQQAKGKARQVKGVAQEGLGGIQDLIRGPRNKT